MPFNLFRKKKQPEQEAPSMQEPQQEVPTVVPQEATPEATEPAQEQAATTQEQLQENPSPVQEQSQEQTATEVQVEKSTVEEQSASKTYLKAMPLKELPDVENVKNEVRNGNIVILRVTPLAGKSIEGVKSAVNELYQFTEEIGGDIARLGEERVVICPKSVRIWREKTPAPVSGNEPLPTAA